MKKIITLLAFIAFCNISAQDNWYKGGNLHKATVKEWKAGSDQNKLATSADWIVAIRDSKKIPLGTKDEIKEKAVIISKCVDKKSFMFKSKRGLATSIIGFVQSCAKKYEKQIFTKKENEEEVNLLK